jgi:WD repeat-containing protein 19
MLTISNESGETIRSFSLRETPSWVTFSERKQDVRSTLQEGTVSFILSKKTLCLYSIDEPESPIELAFQEKYGQVINYQW